MIQVTEEDMDKASEKRSEAMDALSDGFLSFIKLILAKLVFKFYKSDIISIVFLVILVIIHFSVPTCE